NGIVTPAEDVGAAAAAVADLLENQHHRARLADGAKRTDLSSWGLESMCESVEQIYQSVLESAVSPERPDKARIRDRLAGQTFGLHGF
ncbi:MAG: glycosyltransferase family 1 protein, partial [Mesorhizobium sp.]